MALEVQKLLAFNLRRMRNLRRISQKTLAERCQTSLTHIAEIETCRKFPSAAKLQALVDGLACSPTDLFSPRPEEMRDSPTDSAMIADGLRVALRKIEHAVSYIDSPFDG